ncbi:dimethyl sulfoxide reductase anchor subunit family protein [Clostridium arbusti]|uniref:dimethyl sulfoxide reductase anchor subunit family protein n=1 Tax=Clostridium arbusti TaxID=1137848 RepID=UPI00028897F1|nr:DmsC/YnfH family molybdoenzyme membrane anchor subunit [Clostridium arbusti]
MSELGLLIFSIGIESSVGIILFLAINKLKNKDSVKKLPVIVAAAFIIIGILAYLLYLGQPLKVLYVLRNIRNSWLSRGILFSEILAVLIVLNAIITFVKPSARLVQSILTLLAVVIGLSWLSKEILFFGILIVLIVVNAIITFVKPSSKLAQNILIWSVVVIGLIDVAIMGNVYTFASVPSWDGAKTFIDFYTNVVLIGGILYYAFDYKDQTENFRKIIGGAILLALIVQIISGIFYSVNLSTLGLAGSESAKLLNEKSALVVLKYLFEIAGVTFFFWKEIREKSGKSRVLIKIGNESRILSVAFIIISAIISKYLFYTIFISTKIGRI